jgi:hypothetical protein
MVEVNSANDPLGLPTVMVLFVSLMYSPFVIIVLHVSAGMLSQDSRYAEEGNMPVSYIEHKGKKILFVDYSSCKSPDETIQVLEEAAKEFEKSPVKLLSLDNYNNAFASDVFMKRAKELGNTVISAKREKGAIIGLGGAKRVLLRSYNLFVKDKLAPFETKEDALEYLVSE